MLTVVFVKVSHESSAIIKIIFSFYNPPDFGESLFKIQASLERFVYYPPFQSIA